jgi:CDP-diacylglycerol pyrophosphatase
VRLVAVVPFASSATAPDVLWKIVHEQCVQDEQASDRPAPCAEVDLQNGAACGTPIMKDIVSNVQFLWIPAARITDIDDSDFRIAS